MNQGDIPHKLIPPDALMNVLCKLAKEFQGTYKLRYDCNEWAFFYRMSLASVARTGPHYILRVDIPIYADEPERVVVTKTPVPVSPTALEGKYARMALGITIS